MVIEVFEIQYLNNNDGTYKGFKNVTFVFGDIEVRDVAPGEVHNCQNRASRRDDQLRIYVYLFLSVL